MEIITFKDDFNDNSNGWPLIKNETTELEIVNSSYLMKHKSDKGSHATWRTFNIVQTKAFFFETKIKIIETSDEGEFGIIWGLRIDNSNNWDFSIFTIKNNKFYIGTYYHKGDQYKAINPWTFSPLINIGNDAKNILKIMKFDDQLDKQLFFLITEQMFFQTNYFFLFDNQVGFILFQKITVAIDFFKIQFYFNQSLIKK